MVKYQFVKEEPDIHNTLILPKGSKIILPDGQEFHIENTTYLQRLSLSVKHNIQLQR